MNIASIFSHSSGKTACISSAGLITYSDLYRRAENLAKHIVLRGASRVVVYGHKEFSMIVAYAACLRAGAAYIPVSPTLPVGRRKAIAAQAEAGLVLCAVGRGFAGAGNVPTENILRLSDAAPAEDVQLPELASIPDDELAYVIYTSGSTGEPKGVKATRRNLNNFIDWIDKTIPLDDSVEGSVLNLSMFSIDLSMVDIYYALTHGRTLVTTDTEQQHHLSDLYPHIGKSDAALMVMTPTLAEFLMRSHFNREMMPRLRVIYMSGESLHPGTVRRLLARFDENLKVFNGYGPTEATCNVCAAEITDEMCDDRLPIGVVSAAATDIYVMKGGQPVPDGEEGEIVLVGDSVTAGYGRDEDGGFCTYSDGRPAYHTGDIGMKSAEGLLYWSFRQNSLIKVGGYRIEPGDVENHMCRIQGVTGCGVVERYGHLVAYVTLNREMTPGQVRAAARPHLPAFMIPGIVRIVDALPMTENGKLDRDQLE